MGEVVVNILTVTNATGSGEGPLVDTLADVSGDSTKLPKYSDFREVRFFLSVTALAGTTPTMDITLVTTVAGIDYLIGTFAQNAAGASDEMIVVATCPANIKAVYTHGGTVTDFDCTIDCARVYAR